MCTESLKSAGNLLKFVKYFSRIEHEISREFSFEKFRLKFQLSLFSESIRTIPIARDRVEVVIVYSMGIHPSAWPDAERAWEISVSTATFLAKDRRFESRPSQERRAKETNWSPIRCPEQARSSAQKKTTRKMSLENFSVSPCLSIFQHRTRTG